MYFYVRFTGVMAVIFGALLMLVGASGAIYGFVQAAAVLDMVNNSILEPMHSQFRLADTQFITTMLGLGMFLFGMGLSALGQLMLVFVDIANNTRENTTLLRSLRNRDL